jgi:hypothetical protein
MRKAHEEITNYIDDGLVRVTNSGPLLGPVKGMKIRRNKKGILILATKSDGSPNQDREGHPAGTVRQSNESIEFEHVSGGRGVVRGVVPHNYISHSRIGESTETVEKSGLTSAEINFCRKEKAAFLIEWVDNISDDCMWPHMVDYRSTRTSTETLGSQEHQLTISESGERFSGGRSAMRLIIGGIELFLVKNSHKNRRKRLGRIVYRSCPNREFREKARECLSFALGLPIVYYGHTEFCADWIPTSAMSLDAFSIKGSVYSLYDQPPFPIYDTRLGRMLDSRLVETIANSIFDRYDELNFRDLSWSYWHAVCAPAHIAAAHFGAVIEQFQRASSENIHASRKGMLDDEHWKTLRAKIRATLASTDIPSETLSILRNKIDSLNQAPQGMILKRLFDRLGLTLGDAELNAWRHRNIAAHGHLISNPVEVILNSKVLRVLFHRMLAGVTYCSDSYMDYYNLDFPTRALSDPVPARVQ